MEKHEKTKTFIIPRITIMSTSKDGWTIEREAERYSPGEEIRISEKERKSVQTMRSISYNRKQREPSEEPPQLSTRQEERK